MKTIGVFDSGVGGLSVLRALLLEMPEARFVYVADGAYTPYGERSAAQVSERAQAITARLREVYAIDALVVACNTATALAIESQRQSHPDLPIVGVEPALKPAAAMSQTGHIGVLATRGTVESERFARLRARLEKEASRPLHYSCQACDGLADAIERDDQPLIRSLCARYLHQLASSASTPLPMDTLVLGCTHYPFAADTLGEMCGPGVMLVETGAPVARRTRSVLNLAPHPETSNVSPKVELLSTGDPAPLALAARRWLGLDKAAARLDC